MSKLWAALGAMAWLMMSAGCVAPPPARLPQAQAEPPPRDPSWVCSKLRGEFLGLPASDGGAEAPAPAPLAGRWWVRGCSLELVERAQLRLRLDGPGWYWVDADDGDIELHQQVPLQLSAEIVGTVRAEYTGGVAWLWFEPSREARVKAVASTELQLHGATPWGSVLRHIPFLPLRTLTADKLSATASEAFQARLSKGVTVTYDVFGGQADMALGLLARGERPARPFEDGTPWLANDRLLLPAGATQVFGPIQPAPLQLDMVVERGPGVVYRAICTADMASNIVEVARGRPELVPDDAVVTSGTILGSGAHTGAIDVEMCAYYLVVSSAGGGTTVAALRLRS